MRTPANAVIFDLDGTLLDTLGDIAGAMNQVLEGLGVETIDPPAYKPMIGNGVAKLVERALRYRGVAGDEVLARCVGAMREAYDLSAASRTRPYPGVVSLLDDLRSKNIALGVCTNKPHELSLRVLSATLGAGTFASVVGARDGLPHKPDPRPAYECAHALGRRPAECVFVGDSLTDAETARRAGMPFVGVAWGFSPRADLVAGDVAVLVDSSEQLAGALAELIGRQAAPR